MWKEEQKKTSEGADHVSEKEQGAEIDGSLFLFVLNPLLREKYEENMKDSHVRITFPSVSTKRKGGDLFGNGGLCFSCIPNYIYFLIKIKSFE